MRANNPSSSGCEAVADALLRARDTRQPVDAAPLERALASPEDAYAVQAHVARASGWHGHGTPRFWKSGGASRPSVLTHAALPERGVMPSPADARGQPLRLRLIEAEVALRLGRDVTPEAARALSHEEAIACVDAMAVSLEIVESRWLQGVQAAALLKLADLQSHGALVLGEWRAFTPRDWRRQGGDVRIGQAAPHAWCGTHALDDPTWLLPAWLRHVTREGATAPRGTVVTTGTWCGMLPAQAGDAVHARFEGIGEAFVQL